MDFAKENEKPDKNFWNSVIFSDESKFNIHGSDGHQNVWRKVNAALELKNMRGTVKHGGGSIMVQNVKLGGHQTCLSINRLWHELCDMLRRLVGTTAPEHHDSSIQE
ncbi:transposable element Tcb1 transposase [Trichonephila clavipes]|uniref:Transposable element Tcb1 transposase n=1 Tax=Trichonephila clavipes TaxID=2585209 RepID=A0A8X6V5W2_TRICX|nr:transposable element Tcb1 transposase [Trichonephila clavipes]